MECKIFISSTFKDMQNERDVIRNEVLPEIERYAFKYGVSIDIVDLRWGINTDECESSDAASVKILKTCFDEITICKPFFIGVIGERYGWIPSLNNIKNSIDTAFLDRIEFKEKSVTEYEMDFALSTYEENNASFIFCLRNKINGELSNEDKKVYYSNNEIDKERIKILKEKIKTKCPNKYLEYEANIINNNFELNEFKDKLIDALKKEIDLRFSTLIKPQNDIEKELIYQNALINNKANYFSGRQNILENINSFYNSNEKILGIYGVSGIGKSSIISHEIAKSLKEEKIATLYFLCGVSDNSNFEHNLLVTLYYQLTRYLNISFDNNYLNTNYLQEHYEELESSFYVALIELAKIKKVRIYVDALDQLSLSDSGSVLTWLNAYYLNSLDLDIKIIFSYIPFDYINSDIILKNINTLELNGINEEDIILITKSILDKNKKTIPKKTYDIFLSKKNNNELCTSNPLYLSMVLQEIINFDYSDFKNIDLLKEEKNLSDEDAIYTYVYNLIDNAPITIGGQLLSLINRIKQKLDSEFVDVALGIISMSRNGVSESLIKGVFEELGLNFDAADFSYLKKTLRLFFKENNKKIDYSHKIIDDVLEDLYFNKYASKSLEINNATVRYLSKLEDSEFKKQEYLFYLKLVDNYGLFSKYLLDNKNDEIIINSFFGVYNEIMKDKKEQDFFFLSVLDNTKDITLDLIDNINNSELAFYIKEKLLLDILSNNKDLSLEIVIKIYSSLIKINYYYKSSKVALSYIAIYLKLVNKYLKNSNKYPETFKDIYCIYRDILLANKSIFILKLFIKKHINKTSKINNLELSDYFKLEELNILRRRNYSKYQRKLKEISLFDMNNSLYLLMIKREQYQENEYLSILDSHNFEYVYDNLEILEKAKKYALNNGKSIDLIMRIKGYINEIDKKLKLEESLELIKKKAYFLSFIGELYLTLNDLDRARTYLNQSLDLYELINKLSDNSDDLVKEANVLFYLEVINKNNHEASSKLYKRYRKYNKYEIDTFTRVVDVLMKIATFGYMTLIYIVGMFYISLRPYVFSFIKGGEINEVFQTYIFDNTEVFIFLLMGSFIIYILYYLHSFNKKSMKAHHYIKNSNLYFILSIIVIVALVIFSNIYYKNEYQNSLVFLFTNIIIGSISLFVIIYYFGRIIYYRNKINYHKDFNLFKKEINKNYILDLICVSLTLLFLISTMIFSDIKFFKLWHINNVSELAFILVLIANTCSLLVIIIEGIKRRSLRKGGDL